MPSRKKSYRKTSKRGSRKGRKVMKRSLRFMPKLVIQERADTIEDTLNATMGKTTHRIPGDVANIIQEYEGGKYLYFAYDPELNEFSYSSTTPLKGGEKVIVSYNPDDDMYPRVYFIEGRISMLVNMRNRRYYYVSRIALVVISKIEIGDEDDEDIKDYILRNNYPSFISYGKRRFGDNNVSSMNINDAIKINIKKHFHYPNDDLGEEDYKVIYENVLLD
jgi:hypothetical protein